MYCYDLSLARAFLLCLHWVLDLGILSAHELSLLLFLRPCVLGRLGGQGVGNSAVGLDMCTR